MPPPKGVAVLVTVTVAVAVSQSFGRFSYSVLLTDIRADLGISNTIAGTLGSANLAMYLVGSVAVTLLIGALGTANVARLGLAGVTVGLVLLSWSPNIAVVALGLVATGFMAAGVWVTAPALATRVLGAERRASAIGMTSAGVGVGMVVSSWLDTVVDWRDVYRIETVVAVVATLVAVVLIRPEGPRVVGVRPGFGAIKDIPGWRAVTAAYAVFGAGMAIVLTFLVALLEDDAGYSPSRASTAFLVLAIGSIVGGPVYGRVIDRFGTRVGLVSSFVLMAVATSVIATGHRPLASVAACSFGLAFAGVPVSVAATVTDHTTGDSFGAAYGVATLAFGVGLTAGPQLAGAVADAAGSFRPVFFGAAGLAVLGAALSWSASGAIRPNTAPRP